LKNCTDYCYNPIYSKLTEEYTEAFYRYEDEKGKYRLSDLTGAGVTKSNDLEWNRYNPRTRNRHWAIPIIPIVNIVGSEKASQLTTLEKLEMLYENDLIEISKNGVPSFKRYLETSKGALLGNIWVDIPNVQPQAKEKIGYPTQKPEKLLDRIIKMSSNQDDIVFDPFVGGGTTVAIADKLNRQWIGIDQSVQAVKVTELRIYQQQDLNCNSYIAAKGIGAIVTQLYKYDYDMLRYQDAFEFESFIIQQFNGIPQNKKGGDKGIDGKTREGTPIQVKRSDDIGVNVVKNFFVSAMQFDKTLFESNKSAQKPVGFIIAFSFGKGAIQEVARLKNEENVIIQLNTVESIVPIAKKPTLTVTAKDLGINKKGINEIEFIANGQSETKIEFYSWDFNYKTPTFKAEIIRDTEGKQIKSFKSGIYEIAAKVVDSNGLENTEIIKLKINGKIEINH